MHAFGPSKPLFLHFYSLAAFLPPFWHTFLPQNRGIIDQAGQLIQCLQLILLVPNVFFSCIFVMSCYNCHQLKGFLLKLPTLRFRTFRSKSRIHSRFACEQNARRRLEGTVLFVYTKAQRASLAFVLYQAQAGGSFVCPHRAPSASVFPGRLSRARTGYSAAVLCCFAHQCAL